MFECDDQCYLRKLLYKADTIQFMHNPHFFGMCMEQYLHVHVHVVPVQVHRIYLYSSIVPRNLLCCTCICCSLDDPVDGIKTKYCTTWMLGGRQN